MNKTLAFLAILSLAVALPSLETMSHYIADGFEQMEHKFGALHLKKESDSGSDHVIVFPKKGFPSEKEHYAQVHNAMAQAQQNPPPVPQIEQCVEGDLPDFFRFLPTYVLNIIPDGSAHTFSAPCFGQNTISANILDDETIELIHIAEEPSSLLCQDAYFYATVDNYHVTSLFYRGQHRYIFQNLTPAQFQEMTVRGLSIFRFCDHLMYILPDVVATALMFVGSLSANTTSPLGSHPPFWMTDINLDFVKQTTGYVFEKRAENVLVDLDKTLIKSGDFIALTRFGGTPQIIQYGAGGPVGHSVMAIWHDEELWFVESNGGWWWPHDGVQKNKYEDWIQYCWEGDCLVTWLPLKEEYRQKFNATAAWDWFVNGIEGLPYGHHNFIYGWIDTAEHSFPPLLRPELLAPAMSVIEKANPTAADAIYTAGLNMRLGTHNLSIPEIAEILIQKNMTFQELVAVPEQDFWEYNDGYNYVCSAFVVAMWKAGGLFDGYDVQATEWTPRDIYQCEFIDPSPYVPENCKSVDPTNPYCQIMGAWRLTFDGISTVPIYSFMNEHCPSEPPLYERTPGC